jgi:hypothetical protein
LHRPHRTPPSALHHTIGRNTTERSRKSIEATDIPVREERPPPHQGVRPVPGHALEPLQQLLRDLLRAKLGDRLVVVAISSATGPVTFRMLPV